MWTTAWQCSRWVLGLLAVVLGWVATVALGMSRAVGLLTFTGTPVAGIVTVTLGERPIRRWLVGLVRRFCGLTCGPGRFSSPGIFISYRRDEAGPYAGFLKEGLSRRLKNMKVVMDLDSIPPGSDFAEVIRDDVRSSAVLIALIGPQWATTVDEHGYKLLDNPDDYVRFEVQTALEHGVWVVPALIDGARLPRQLDLPRALHKLAQLQAFELTGTQYNVNRLVELIRQIPEPPRD
jgi:hypothetical protein